MWISSQFLSWEVDIDSVSVHAGETWKRSYIILAHAEQILQGNTISLHLVDTITTIRRAVDHRIRLLKRTYDFDSMPISSKPKRDLDLLEYFGIIRHNMLLQLVQIRNKIEHEDADPPDRERCKEFLDLVWYFLRSTDRLVKRSTEGFFFKLDQDIDSGYEIYLRLKDKWRFELSGWLAPNMVSNIYTDGWLEIEKSDIQTINQLIQRAKSSGDDALLQVTKDRNLDKNDVRCRGIIKGPESILHSIYTVYFAVD